MLDAMEQASWLQMASTLSEDSAPSASLDNLKAQAVPTRPGAPPERLAGLPWPQQPASGRPKAQGLPLSTTTTRQAAAAKGVRCLRIDGATPASERQALVQTFQAIKPGTPAVFALSILAAGQGLTLTAAHTVVFGELRWVPGELLQAEARQLVERVLHPV